MQRCQYCGQLNDDYEENCAYCGEPFYITVNHEDDEDVEHDINRLYAMKIAQELLDDEKKRQEKLKRQKEVKFDDFTKELLDENTFEENIEEDPFINDDIYEEEDKGVYDTYNPYMQTPNVMKESHIIDENSYIDTDNQFSEETIEEIEIDHSEDEEELPEFIEEINNVDEEEYSEELLTLAATLRAKLKRNKKLENKLGLNLDDIELNLINTEGPIEITGTASLNKNLRNKALQLSIISYDSEKIEIDRESITIPEITKDTLYDFNILCNPEISDVAIIIILPEIIKNTTKHVQEQITEPKYTHAEQTQENSIFIEQMREIEHKIGMNISNTSILIKSQDSLEVVGEIYIENPEKCKNIKIAATCYDYDNNIIYTETMLINTKMYLGFDTLSVKINNIDISSIERIRIYPTFQ
ncbi:zinc ribbon domain-containing protein [Methanosphaera sp.]